MNKISGLLLLLSCFFSTSSWSEHKNVEWQLESSGELVEQAQKFINRSSKPQGLAQHLSEISAVIDDHKVKTRIKAIWYLGDADSVSKYGTEIIYFNELTESIRFHTALTIDSNGKIHSFSPSSAQVVDSDSYTTFSDDKQLVMAMPGLASGSVLVLDYEVILDRSQLEMNWSEIIYVNNLYPKENLRLSYSWPEGQELYWHSDSDLLQCETQPTGVICEANNLSAFKEDNSVLWRDVLPQFQISEIKSWEHVRNLAYREFQKSQHDTSGLKELLSSLSLDNLTTEQKINSVHHYSARDIRYVSMSEHGNTITPHSVAEVIRRKYGDCKDKSALLVALLRHLGIEAHPVLIATDRKNSHKLAIPSMSYFNHMIVCFKHNDQPFCIDATDQTTGWKHISAWIQGAVSLALHEQALPSQMAINPYRWEIELDTNLEFDDKGGVKEVLDRRFKGEYSSYVRNQMTGKSSDEKHTWLTELYQELVSSKSQPHFKILSEENINSDLNIQSETYYPPFTDPEKKLSYTEYDYWLKSELNSIYLSNKLYPQLNQGLKYSSKMTISLGDNWKVTRQTSEVTFEHLFGRMSRTVDLNKQDKMVVVTKIEIPSRDLPAEEIPLFNDFLSLLYKHSSITIGGITK
ncbi:DUF3857 and transglutaminase domain-containing protein [uncultured Pseudoteredinibacter sp.]|uniref:DUF3857 domain-containing transglutaminase family protein n=1 Tax=uncultured Pseudoteredinibacter sp. TaxID=1641701 RepID=UPI002623F165|nr:DUF3857 and transglutaminase domain-containing protein [uncultured Pseudoteredinibacter sp.]